ncbi:hypothetical protein GCM10009559_34690 [Pseudonocardia zijingensis]|uniref:Uncharacterized protein n=1 Tax=Pseudonocardia zijingensis TaxID=153376 RepID=A0ABN1QAQ1_9PSEU
MRNALAARPARQNDPAARSWQSTQRRLVNCGRASAGLRTSVRSQPTGGREHGGDATTDGERDALDPPMVPEDEPDVPREAARCCPAGSTARVQHQTREDGVIGEPGVDDLPEVCSSRRVPASYVPPWCWWRASGDGVGFGI